MNRPPVMLVDLATQGEHVATRDELPRWCVFRSHVAKEQAEAHGLLAAYVVEHRPRRVMQLRLRPLGGPVPVNSLREAHLDHGRRVARALEYVARWPGVIPLARATHHRPTERGSTIDLHFHVAVQIDGDDVSEVTARLIRYFVRAGSRMMKSARPCRIRRQRRRRGAPQRWRPTSGSRRSATSRRSMTITSRSMFGRSTGLPRCTVGSLSGHSAGSQPNSGSTEFVPTPTKMVGWPCAPSCLRARSAAETPLGLRPDRVSSPSGRPGSATSFGPSLLCVGGAAHGKNLPAVTIWTRP